MMLRLFSAFVALVLIVSASKAQSTAQQLRIKQEVRGDLINDVDKTTVAMHPATPYIESTTFAVVDIDIKAIDVERAADWLFESGLSEPDTESAQAIAMAGGFVESLETAGVGHLYVLASTRSILDGGPLVVIPCENPAVVNGLASVIVQSVSKRFPQTVHLADKLVLAGPKTAVARVLAVEGVIRDDLILPLKQAGRLHHQLIISLPEEARTELIAFWPDRVPAASPIQFSPQGLVRDIRQIAISFSLPPEPKLRAEFKVVDAVAAERTSDLIQKAIALSPELADTFEIKSDISNVVVEAEMDAFAQLMQMLTSPARQRAQMMQRMNQMKQLGLAIHRYHEKENRLPPRSVTDDAGNPLLSWRATLLPYLEQRGLYEKLKLEQAWNSQQNLANTRVAVGAFAEDAGSDLTRFRAPVYPGSLWEEEGTPRSLKEVIDGISNTIALIHAPAEAAVNWADPQPWVLSQDDPASDVFGDRDQVATLLLDGSVRVFTREELGNERLKAMLTFAGKELVE